MKIKDDYRIRNYVDEYIKLGIQLEFFNPNQARKFHNNLLNKEFEYDTSLPGDAFTEGDSQKIIINPNRTFSSDKKASLILFHEFTHCCSNLHQDLYSKDFSLLNNFKKNMDKRKNTIYQHNYSTTQVGEINNPYTYFLFGLNLLDEVTAENTAEEMVACKYRILRKPTHSETRYLSNNKQIPYNTNLSYYGIGQELADGFSKTLFLPNKNKNLNGLCKEIFKDNFVKDLIYQHCESSYDLECLYKELGYIGVIGFTEEKRNRSFKKSFRYFR